MEGDGKSSHDCQITYWSILVPSGLAWDGRRWHVRAWCGTRNAWMDFEFGRMISVKWPSVPAKELPEDKGWTNFEKVKLRINPNLDADQREALRMDYDLAGDILELGVRAIMKPYLLAAMFIDHKSHSDLPRHFVLE